MLEAEKDADDLLVKLQADRKEQQALFKDNSVGFFGSLLSGVSGTGQQEGELDTDQKSLIEAVRKANEDYAAAVGDGKDAKVVQASSQRRNEAIRRAYQSQIDTLRAEAGRLRKEEIQSKSDADFVARTTGETAPVTDNSAKIANVEGRAQKLQHDLALQTAQQQGAALEGKVSALRASGERKGSDDKEAAQRLKAMEAHVAEWKLLAPVTQQAIFSYWETQRRTFAVGSSQYNSILEKQATIAEEGARKVAEGIEKFRAARLKAEEEASKINVLVSKACRAGGWTMPSLRMSDSTHQTRPTHRKPAKPRRWPS